MEARTPQHLKSFLSGQGHSSGNLGLKAACSAGEGCKASGAQPLVGSGCFSLVEMFPRTAEPTAAAFTCLPSKETALSPVPSSRDARTGSFLACARGAGTVASRKSKPGQLKIDCLSEFSMRPLRLLISPLLFWHGTSCRWSNVTSVTPRLPAAWAGHEAVVPQDNGCCRVHSSLSFSRTNWVEVKPA